MSLNLGGLLANSTRQYGSETALIYDSERYTYDELDGYVRKFAAELIDAGVQPGDNAAIMIPNCPPFSIAYFGILYAGGTVVTMNTLQSADEVVYQLTDSQAKVFILHADCKEAGLEAYGRCDSCSVLYFVTDSDADQVPANAKHFAEVLERSDHADLCQTMPDDTAVVLYTSGTTGHPKGAELTHYNLYHNAQYIAERSFSIWPKEINVVQPGFVGLAGLPLYHIFGQTNIQNAMLLGGGTASYLKRFTPGEAVRAIERDKVAYFPGVPTMYFAILHDEECKDADLSSLRFCVSGGAPMPVEVKGRFEEKFGVRIQEGYGLTETSPIAVIQRPDETTKCGTPGKPIAGVDLKILDENDQEVPQGERGEIVMRGPNIMKGYYKNPEATAEAMRGGWFHSGDIGYIDEEGDVFIVDRKKDMILRGGYNVYPREVEEVLYTHPAVMEAAVIGIPDERYGEEIKAVISLKPEQQATSEEIIAYCKKHLAAYKYPRHLEIRDALPKGPTGKLLKRVLRET
ncbi:MAG: long-chain fatty acid--CoA ligase [Verrucomicrobia bacterium]|nr:long-chain fatty acid--CoA ligase [Verrucomicrobiota bacterium]